MSRKWTIWLAAVAVAVLVLAVFADSALADDVTNTAQHVDVKETGNHVGELIRKIFIPIVVTIGGVIGIAAIVKRDYVLALSLVGVTIVVLGFLLPNSPYQGGGEDIIRTVFGIGGTIGVRW